MAVSKKWLAKPAGPLAPITDAILPPRVFAAYKNNRYVVTLRYGKFPFGGDGVIAMVQRHDDKPIPNHWREMQKVKNEIFGPEALAIECYPPESKLIDEANIYWLWVSVDSETGAIKAQSGAYNEE
jgi:hypothetical protein